MQPCDGWPAGGWSGGAGAVVPLFPLPGVFLFPGTLMPLHIFEPRYRAMIEDSLDGPGRIVVAALCEGHERDLSGAPPVHDIAGLGEIQRHERLPDGRFLILLAGLGRVMIREVPSDGPYRRVEGIALREPPVAPEREGALRRDLMRAVLQRAREPLELPPDMPLGQLADLLLLRLELPASLLAQLFALTGVSERALRALEEHALRPRPLE